jgi:hypothetical protein
MVELSAEAPLEINRLEHALIASAAVNASVGRNIGSAAAV